MPTNTRLNGWNCSRNMDGLKEISNFMPIRCVQYCVAGIERSVHSTFKTVEVKLGQLVKFIVKQLFAYLLTCCQLQQAVHFADYLLQQTILL